MPKYILSKYNYYKENDKYASCVNLHTKKLFAIDIEKYQRLITFKDELDKLKLSDPVFFNTMHKLGIIRAEDDDENIKNILLLENRNLNFNSSFYRLTINPTLNCNFNCWYCYEDHPRKHMNSLVKENVWKFINNLLDKKRFNEFYLDWFGGEPLLHFKKILEPLALQTKKLCDKKNVYFESGITTNGFLLNKEMIKGLKEINMQSFQITLDGNKKFHNKTRFSKSRSNSYDKIINNIISLIEHYSPKDLAVRINFTKENFNSLVDIIDSFPYQLRNKIKILHQQVWQDKELENISIEEIEESRMMFKNAGFNIDHEILNIKGYTCYADLYNQAVINYDGRVFKCTARNFEKESEDGFLTKDGTIEWDNNLLSSQITKATFENDFCYECKYLPVCFGPCSQKKIHIEKHGNFEKYCFKLGIEDTLKYIMSEYEKGDKKLTHLLNFR